MKFNKNFIGRFQEGGQMQGAPEQGAPTGPEGGAPAPGPEGGNPEEQLQQLAAQLVQMLMQQIGDPQAVTAILQMALEMVQQAGQPQYQRIGGVLKRVR